MRQLRLRTVKKFTSQFPSKFYCFDLFFFVSKFIDAADDSLLCRLIGLELLLVLRTVCIEQKFLFFGFISISYDLRVSPPNI